MDAKALKATIKTQITNASGFLGGEIAAARTKAMRYYLGEPMGNEIDGRSQVVSSDVLDVVESVKPDVMQIFTTSDEAVRFDPSGPEDEEGAKQATDYANHVFYKDNNGFIILHDGFTDAFLQKNGIAKIWWDKTEKIERRQYTGLTDDQLSLLMMESSVDVIEHEAHESELGPTHDVTIKRVKSSGQIRIENVPPDEFLVTRRAKSLDDAPFMAHRTSRTQSDLIEEGYDKEQVEALPTGDGDFYNEEKSARHSDEEDTGDEEADRSTREIDVYECYLKVDWDGDGIAELRKVTVAGDGYEILKFKDGSLDNEAIFEHPFVDFAAIRLPHKFFAMSLADMSMDLQAIKTSVWRQVLDNMYNVNNGRAAISNKVSIEDYLDNKVGAPIRVDSNAADVAGHIQPIVTAPIGNHAYPLLELIDTYRETRTGVNRLSQGLDPDALKNTATGIERLLSRSQQRVLLMAQVLAVGVAAMFKKILRLSIEHQDKPRTIRLRNKWVEIDPRSWNADMDVSVDVGLGRGTRDQQIATTQQVLQTTFMLVQMQGGVNGPFVYAHNVRNAAAKHYESIGVKSSDPFLADIGKEESAMLAQQAQQSPPPPEIMLEQMKQQGAQQAAQQQAALTQQKAELEAQTKQLEHQQALERIGAETNLERTKQATKQLDLEHEEARRAMDLAAEEHKKAMDVAAHERSTEIDTQAAQRKSDLDKESTEYKHDLSIAEADHKAEAAGIKKPKKKAKPGQPEKPTIIESAVMELAKQIGEQGALNQKSIEAIAQRDERTAELINSLKDEMKKIGKPKKSTAKRGSDGSWQIEHA